MPRGGGGASDAEEQAAAGDAMHEIRCRVLDAIRANNEWAETITADLVEQTREGEAARRARAGRRATVEARAAEKHAELVDAVERARERCKPKGSATAQVLDWRGGARNSTAQTARGPPENAAPAATAQPWAWAATREAPGHDGRPPAEGTSDAPISLDGAQDETAPAAAKKRKATAVTAHRYNPSTRRDEYAVERGGASRWERLEDIEDERHKDEAARLHNAHLWKNAGFPARARAAISRAGPTATYKANSHS